MSLIIRLSSDHDFVSGAVRLFLWSKYSHVDILLPSGFYVGAIPGSGVVVHNKKCDVADFFELDCTDQQKELAVGYALSQCGKGYDYTGIFSFLARRDWQADDKWFCSELLAASVHAAEIPLFNASANRVTPRDHAINARWRQIAKPSYAL